MAYIVERARTNKTTGKTEISYQVKWRQGNTANGKGESETIHDPGQAALFKKAVEAAGGHWPPNYIPKVGWVTPDVYRQLMSEGIPEPESQAPSFADFAAAWVESLSGIQGQSRHRYRRIIALHIVPWFGNAAISDTKAISTATIGSWINQLQAGTPDPATGEPREKLGPKSVRNIHGVLSSILQSAADTEPPLRPSNPCSKTRLPKIDDGEGDEEMVFVSPEEFATIASFIRPDAAPLAWFLVGTGLRYSEATAVQVRDLELLADRPRLRVRRAWKKQEGGGWELGPPKTPKSRRGVGLTPEQVDGLLPLIAGRRPDDLVFVGPGGGRWIHQTFYTQRWRPAVYKAVRCEYHRGLDLKAGIGQRGYRYLTGEQIVPCGCPGVLEKVPRIHDLRHSQVAWLIAANQPMPAIQRRLGHESIQTTIDRYGHLLPEVDDDLVVALDALMSRGRVSQPVAF